VVRAEPEASLGDALLTLRAEAEGCEPRDIELSVSIEPAYWRPNWRKAPDAVTVQDMHKRWHYSEIDVPAGDVLVRFVLVARDIVEDDKRIEDLQTFYIMRDKVWNDLYAHFAAAEPAKAGKTWEKGAEVMRRNDAMDLGWESNRQLPALRMTVEQAHHFAVWLGDSLPSARQWDKASGYYKKDRGKGPFRIPLRRKETPSGSDWQPGEIAINRPDKGPMSVGTATCDVSPYGCRDMAGNGCEWTRDLVEANPRTIPLTDPRSEDSVTLRGKGYHVKQPWLFRIVDDLVGIAASSYLEPKPYIGFRVVIPLN
jgi:hypothetical protein